jgi:hypothetical protein
MEMDRRVCTAYLISVCVRMFLERRERQLSEFVAEFRSGLPDGIFQTQKSQFG